jgi:hypothetical protein
MFVRFLSSFALLTASSVAVGADWKPAPAPLMTKWGKQVTPDNVWKEHPRPQLQRADWLNLNGLWHYAITPQGSAAPKQWDGEILVPFAVESALSGVGKTLTSKQALWYGRSIEVPEKWNGRRVILRFEAVDWHTSVWVNGKEQQVLGDPDADGHSGGFTPFAFDITDALKEGKNAIHVRVWDPTDAAAQPRGKQAQKPGGVWYTSVTGIWQTAWLEAVNKPAYITGLSVQPNIDNGQVSVQVEVEGKIDGLTTSVEIMKGGTVLETSKGAGTGHVLTVVNAEHWSPESPKLYRLRVRLHGQKAEDGTDEVGSYFAFRSITAATDEKGVMRLRLNGKPMYQLGVLDQGWWPDGLMTPPHDGAMRWDIETAKALGFNMIRKHGKIEPSRYYAICDTLGMLVWQDIPSGGVAARGHHIGPGAPADAAFTPVEKKQFRKELKAVIDHLRHAPCIVNWVPFTDGWGQHDTNDVLKWVKEYDPSRLVNGPSGWTDRGFGDTKDSHAYPTPTVSTLLKDRARVLGKFGGLGLHVEGHVWKEAGTWSHQTHKTEDDFRFAYRLQTRRLHPLIEKGLGASVYAQLADVETEIDGLMTYDREVLKVNMDEARAWHKAIFGPPPEPRVLLATSEAEAQKWRWTTTRPAADWAKPDFNDADWAEGAGGFGTDAPGATVRTRWTTNDIWVRRTLDLDELPTDVLVRMRHDDYAQVFINGVEVLNLRVCTVVHTDHPLGAAALKAFKKGRNVIAIRCTNDGGAQFLDAGLIGLEYKK